MALYRILYSSSAVFHFGDNELLDLLFQARRDNKKMGITGLLLFHQDSFMQILEGEESTVRKLFFDRIYFDERHTAVYALISEPIKERRYVDFHMGFRTLTKADLENVEGYLSIPHHGLNDDFFKGHPDVADQLMRTFSTSDV